MNIFFDVDGTIIGTWTASCDRSCVKLSSGCAPTATPSTSGQAWVFAGAKIDRHQLRPLWRPASGSRSGTIASGWPSSKSRCHPISLSTITKKSVERHLAVIAVYRLLYYDSRDREMERVYQAV